MEVNNNNNNNNDDDFIKCQFCKATVTRETERCYDCNKLLYKDGNPFERTTVPQEPKKSFLDQLCVACNVRKRYNNTIYCVLCTNKAMASSFEEPDLDNMNIPKEILKSSGDSFDSEIQFLERSNDSVESINSDSQSTNPEELENIIKKVTEHDTHDEKLTIKTMKNEETTETSEEDILETTKITEEIDEPSVPVMNNIHEILEESPIISDKSRVTILDDNTCTLCGAICLELYSPSLENDGNRNEYCAKCIGILNM